MSDERDTQAGSPVEETEASHTEVLAAVERAKDSPSAQEPAAAERVAGEGAAADAARVSSDERDIARPGSDGDIDIRAGADASSADAGGSIRPGESPGATALGAGGLKMPPQGSLRRTSADDDTQPNIDRPVIADADELPSAGASVVETVTVEERSTVESQSDAPARDGEIRISADHPMAALYMQTPMPPELRGNRGAGVLISLLATLAFALLYGAILIVPAAIEYPPSRFMGEGLLPVLTSWGYIAAVVAFFVALAVLVLIVGRAGWWAYVLGGFLVAVLVWAATIVGFAFSPDAVGVTRTVWEPIALIRDFGMTIPVLVAAVVAREVPVWFGAWIGARGRRMTLKNREQLAEYETALAEVRAKQP